MALDFKVGTFATSGSAGDQIVTGIGFQPKLIIIYSVHADGLNTTGLCNMGAATGSADEHEMYMRSQHSTATQDSSIGYDNDSIFNVVSAGGSQTGPAGDIQSLDADGFTINWSVGFGSIPIKYIAIGGDDLTNQLVAIGTPPVGGGNKAFTGFGFEPDFLMFMAVSKTTAGGTTTDPLGQSIGFANATEQAVFAHGVDEGSDPTQVHSYFRTDRCFATIDSPSAAIHNEASFVSFDADGYTLNFGTVNDDTHQYIVIALQGITSEIGTTTAKASTGNKAVTGLAFTPDGVIMGGIGASSSSSLVDGCRRYFGATDGTDDAVCATTDQDNVGTTVARRYQADGEVVNYRDAAGTSETDVATGVSLDAAGFTLNWSTVDGGENPHLYVAMGGAEPPPGTDKEHSASNTLALTDDAVFARDILQSAASILTFTNQVIDLAIRESVGNTLAITDSAKSSILFESVSSSLSLSDLAEAAEVILESITSEMVLSQSITQSVILESVASALNLAQVVSHKLNDDIFLELGNTLVFDNTAAPGNFVYNRALPADGRADEATILFQQTLSFTGDRVLSPSSELLLSGIASLNKESNLTSQSFLSFQQFVGQIHAESASSVLNFQNQVSRIFTPDSQLLLSNTATAETVKAIFNVLALLQSVSLARELNRSVTSALAVVQSLVYELNDPDLCNYSPWIGSAGSGITPPSATAPTLTPGTLQLDHPVDTPTTTVVLRNPNFGNTDTLSFNRIKRESRGGTLLIFADPTWPKTQRLKMQIDTLKLATRDSLQTFLTATIGQEILLTDWESRQWRGIILNPDVDITQTGRDEYSVTLDFEGVLI